MASQEDLIDQVERWIAIVEARATTLAAAIAGLAEAGCDTTEAKAQLQDCRRTLPILRRQLWAAISDRNAE